MRKVFVGGSLASATAIIAAWIAIGVGGNNPIPTLLGYPTAATTGIPAGVTLTPHTGDLQVTVDNTVIDAMDVDGQIIVSASGVTVQRTRAQAVFMEFNTRADNLANPRLTVQDSELDCDNRAHHEPGHPRTAINYRNFNAFRNHISDCENGIDVQDNATIQDNLIDELWNSNDPDGPHTDGIQSSNGSNLLIQHNVIRADDEGCHKPEGSDGSCNGTSAININNNAAGPHASDSLVEDNVLSGGTFTLYCPIPSTTNFRVANNRFSQVYAPTVGEFGPWADCAGETWFGNVYHETGLPVASP